MRFAGYLAKWVGFGLLWLLFVYQITLPEVLVGAGAAALTVFGLEQSLKAEPLHFKPEFRWYAYLWHMPGAILKDLWVLLQTLVRHIQRKPSEALFQMSSFRPSGEEARQGAQRCLATLFLSVSPNSVVVDIDRDRNLMMFHQVKKSPVPRGIRHLEEA